MSMEFLTIKQIADKIGKSERTVYRLLSKMTVSDAYFKTDGKVKLYSENVLHHLSGDTPKDQRENSGSDNLQREIETLKFANNQLSKYTQEAFDRLKQEQDHTKQLTESLKASQSLQLVAEQRIKELEQKVNLLTSSPTQEDEQTRKKRKKKKKKKKFL